MPVLRPYIVILSLGALALATPAIAGPWGGPGWGGPGWGGPGWGDSQRGWNRGASSDSREGRVNAERFVADGAAADLGKGTVAVVAAPGGSSDGRESATFEAAVLDQLAHAGYQTQVRDGQGGQVAEVHVVRDVVVPEEQKHSPVSGEMEAGVSNRGSMVGMAINVDMTKPRKALVETRLEARIRDRVTGKLLWEGHAQIVTREGDSHWTDNAVAGRLAGALFDHFPAADAMAQR
jgi:hypothetical protein